MRLSRLGAQRFGQLDQHYASGAKAAWMPTVDISERKDAYVVAVEVPGVGIDDLEITFQDGLPVRTFWGTVYQTVMEGMFSDPIYGGNRDKAGWKLIGFPGVIAVHRDNVEKYRGKKYTADILGIADLS